MIFKYRKNISSEPYDSCRQTENKQMTDGVREREDRQLDINSDIKMEVAYSRVNVHRGHSLKFGYIKTD